MYMVRQVLHLNDIGMASDINRALAACWFQHAANAFVSELSRPFALSASNDKRFFLVSALTVPTVEIAVFCWHITPDNSLSILFSSDAEVPASSEIPSRQDRTNGNSDNSGCSVFVILKC